MIPCLKGRDRSIGGPLSRKVCRKGGGGGVYPKDLLGVDAEGSGKLFFTKPALLLLKRKEKKKIPLSGCQKKIKIALGEQVDYRTEVEGAHQGFWGRAFLATVRPKVTGNTIPRTFRLNVSSR